MRPLLRPEPALSLALLRVVVAALMPLAPGFREGARSRRGRRSAGSRPRGSGGSSAHVPINGTLATAAQIIVAFAALCAIAGVRARLCFGVLTVAGFYLFAIAQLAGHVFHDNHLLWFCALLAASPCADVLAVDARRPLAAEGRDYAVPLLAVRLLLGAIYFFPGLRKLRRRAWTWALSDNLRNQLYWKWAEYGSVPGCARSGVPWLLHLGGLFVLAFELSFVVLVPFRRTRTAPPWRGWRSISCRSSSSTAVRRACGSVTWRWWTGGRCWRLFPARVAAAESKPARPAGRQLRRAPVVVAALLLVAPSSRARAGRCVVSVRCYPTFQWIAGPRDARPHDRRRRRRRAARESCTRATPPAIARSGSGPRSGAWQASRRPWTRSACARTGPRWAAGAAAGGAG